jgi:hypothetical protein
VGGPVCTEEGQDRDCSGCARWLYQRMMRLIRGCHEAQPAPANSNSTTVCTLGRLGMGVAGDGVVCVGRCLTHGQTEDARPKTSMLFRKNVSKRIFIISLAVRKNRHPKNSETTRSLPRLHRPTPSFGHLCILLQHQFRGTFSTTVRLQAAAALHCICTRTG